MAKRSLAVHRRTGGKVQSVLAPVALLLALVAGLSLGFQLSRVDDMCSVGRENLDIGACMIGSASENGRGLRSGNIDAA